MNNIENQIEKIERNYNPQRKAELRAMARYYNPCVEASFYDGSEELRKDCKFFFGELDRLTEEERNYVIDSSMKQEIEKFRELRKLREKGIWTTKN